LAQTGPVEIRIEASDLPGRSCGPSPDSPGGYHRIHVGIQRRGKLDELLGLASADLGSATWRLDCEAIRTPSGVDFKGRYVQGPPGGRFIYLTWVTIDDAGALQMFRRAKLMLEAVPPSVAAEAIDQGVLVGRLGLTDPKGNPLCAGVRPPIIEWTAEPDSVSEVENSLK
jgi:Family of unknown function (DUF5990)